MTRLPLLLCLALLPAGAARADTILVSVGDDAVHAISSEGRDLGVFASSGLSGPFGLALDRAGNLYVASTSNHTVRAFSPSGQDLGVFASSGLGLPVGLAFDASGNLFVSDITDNTIRKFGPGGQPLGVVVSLLGFGCPSALAFDHDGNLLIADGCANRIRKLSPAGALTIFASSGLDNPVSLSFDGAGNLLVGNGGDGPSFGHSIHRFSAAGGDLGTLVSLRFGIPGGLLVGGSGQLLVADGTQRPGQIDYAIRRFSADGQDLGELVVLPFPPRALVRVASLTTFSTFSAQVKVRRHGDAFQARLAFTLGAGSNGIDPPGEPVLLRLGALTLTIPSGSFRQVGRRGLFFFHGVVDGVFLSAVISARDAGFVMQVDGRGAPLGDARPLAVELTIGDDTGAASAETD